MGQQDPLRIIISTASIGSISTQESPPPRVGEGEIVRQVLPDILAQARNTIRGTIRVFVSLIVDSSGKVTDATVENSGSPYFDKLALVAVRRWEFAPAQGGGTRQWSVRFDITQTSTKVTSNPINVR
jgi:TonB family protein